MKITELIGLAIIYLVINVYLDFFKDVMYLIILKFKRY